MSLCNHGCAGQIYRDFVGAGGSFTLPVFNGWPYGGVIEMHAHTPQSAALLDAFGHHVRDHMAPLIMLVWAMEQSRN